MKNAAYCLMCGPKHVINISDLMMAKEIGRLKYDDEPTHRPEKSVWVWYSKDYHFGCGSEPSGGSKIYMK